MILWYAGLALAVVWNVFRDPAIDHRLVIAGALVPDLLDLPFARPAFAHTLAFSVLLLGVVMAVSRGRRLLRRRLLALPIGTFLHLVLAGTWTTGQVLWWPILGPGFPAGSLVPSLGVAVIEEIAGAWAVGWFVWRFGLSDARRRRAFLRSGRLEVAVG